MLAICRVVEPLAFCSITAYALLMVQDIKGDQDASFYAGLLIASFTAAEACTAWIWGNISDHFGRKPIILIALAGTAVSSIIFGLSERYWLALLARIIAGCINGNTAVMQTMVAEIVTNPEHEPIAYALQPFMWNVGAIAGSALGGFAARPVESYPSLFAGVGAFVRYPYALPNIISAAAIVVALLIGWLFLKETNPNFKNETGQVGSTTAKAKWDNITSWLRKSSTTLSHLKQLFCGSSTIDRRFSTDSTTPFLDKELDDELTTKESISHIDKPKAFTRQVITIIAALCLLSYHQMAFSSLLPIYLLDDTNPNTSPSFHLTGGLNQTLVQIGTVLAINSIMSLVTQGLIYPIYVKTLGVWKSTISVLALAPLPYILIPFVTLLPNHKIGIYVILALQSLATTISYPLMLIFLKNACPSQQVLGRVNGIAMSGCSAARTVAPPLIGIIYSTYGSAWAWWSAGMIAVVGFIQVLCMKRADFGEKSSAMSDSQRLESVD